MQKWRVFPAWKRFTPNYKTKYLKYRLLRRITLYTYTYTYIQHGFTLRYFTNTRRDSILSTERRIEGSTLARAFRRSSSCSARVRKNRSRRVHDSHGTERSYARRRYTRFRYARITVNFTRIIRSARTNFARIDTYQLRRKQKKEWEQRKARKGACNCDWLILRAVSRKLGAKVHEAPTRVEMGGFMRRRQIKERCIRIRTRIRRENEDSQARACERKHKGE